LCSSKNISSSLLHFYDKEKLAFTLLFVILEIQISIKGKKIGTNGRSCLIGGARGATKKAAPLGAAFLKQPCGWYQPFFTSTAS
jgi:hypothetical protein